MRKLLSLLKKSERQILTRYYLLSSKLFGIKLHHIKQSDPEFHTHPWWGISLILGSYVEERQTEDGILSSRRFLVNLISPWTPHRVIINEPTWTLFLHGPRINDQWKYGEIVAPWRGVPQALVPSDAGDEGIVHPGSVHIGSVHVAAPGPTTGKTLT